MTMLYGSRSAKRTFVMIWGIFLHLASFDRCSVKQRSDNLLFGSDSDGFTILRDHQARLEPFLN